MDRLRLSGNLQRQAKAQLESASAEVSTGLEGTIHEAAEDDEMDEELYSFADTVATLRMAVRSEDHDQLQKVIASVVEQRPSTSSAPLRFAHEFNVTTSGSHVIGSVEVASPGPRVKTTDSRVVKHNCSSMQGAKGSPEKCARGVSRNPLGGFYTT